MRQPNRNDMPDNDEKHNESDNQSQDTFQDKKTNPFNESRIMKFSQNDKIKLINEDFLSLLHLKNKQCKEAVVQIGKCICFVYSDDCKELQTSEGKAQVLQEFKTLFCQRFQIQLETGIRIILEIDKDIFTLEVGGSSWKKIISSVLGMYFMGDSKKCQIRIQNGKYLVVYNPVRILMEDQNESEDCCVLF